jgi:hypothetical protein
MKKIISIVLVMSLLVLSSSPVFATTSGQNHNVGEEALNGANFQEIITSYMFDNSYLELNENNDTVITEKYKDYVRANISAEEEVIFTDNTIIIKDKGIPTAEAVQKGGVTKIVWKGIYAEIYIKNSHLQNFIGIADIVGILSAIIPVPVAKVIAVVILANIAIAKRVNQGNGVIYYMGMVPPVMGALVWIRAQ